MIGFGLTIADWAIKASLVIVLAWIVVRMCGRRVRFRRFVWIAALSTVMSLPIAWLNQPRAAVFHVTQSAIARDPGAAAPWPLLIWALGSLMVLAVFASGYAGLLLALRQSKTRPFCDEHSSEVVRGVRIRVSSSQGLKTPVAFGILRPVVLLPACAETWTPSQMRMVLLHELEHVRSRDALAQVLAQAVVTVLWFNPLAWFAAACLRKECEANADEAVLRAGVRSTDYASLLLQFAGGMGRVQHAGLSIASSSRIEHRLLAIVGSARDSGRTPATTGLIVSIMAACLLSMSGELRLASLSMQSRPREHNAEWQRGFALGRAYKMSHPESVYSDSPHPDPAQMRELELALQNRPPP